MQGNKTDTTKSRAREICADLMPHTTSVHNVAVIEDALKAERLRALGEASDAISDSHTALEAEMVVGRLMGKQNV